MYESHQLTRRILIVDDEVAPRSLESFALEGTGRYFVEEAGNGVDALAMIGEREYDCVIIDLDMPDMRGDELCNEIRRRLRSDELPVVLVLPKGASRNDVEIAECLANEIIAKPFEPWDLARVIDMLTNSIAEAGDVLSVDTVLRGFPYPTMILDADHHVLLANGAFYQSTHTGIEDCYLDCNSNMHDDGAVPEACPLEECVRTGATAEREIETSLGKMRVSVYPLATNGPDGQPLYLHVTQPVACESV